MTEPRAGYFAGTAAPPRTSHEAACACGYRFGVELAASWRSGRWWVLHLDGLPEAMTITTLATYCPKCGAPWSYHARRVYTGTNGTIQLLNNG